MIINQKLASFALLVLIFKGTVSLAMEGAELLLPAVGKTGPVTFAYAYSTASDLRLEIDARWFGTGGGHLPARVKIEAKKPAIVDRVVDIELRLASSGGSRRTRMYSASDGTVNAVRLRMVLPANEMEVVQDLLGLVPPDWGTVEVEVLVDGRSDEALSGTTSFRTSQSGSGPEALRVIQPEVAPRAVTRSFRDQTFGTSARSWMVLDAVQCEAFEGWLAYSAADVIRLSLQDLESLASDRAQRLTAIRRWLLAGGTVWIESIEAGGKEPMEEGGLEEVEKLLGIASWQFAATETEKNEPVVVAKEDADEETADDDDAPVKRFLPVAEDSLWNYATAAKKSSTVLEQASELLLGKRAGGRPPGVVDSRRWYAVREAGFGRVYAFRGTAMPAPKGLPPGVGELTRQALRGRDWSQRHGLNPDGKSSDFSNLLVPGVGVAPVTEFQILITLFVLAIGPLNYWLLWRRQQLQMLVITAPLGALAATLGLFAYAAAADGFGVKARARSVTLLDQTSGEAASWSRVTHYATTPPADPPVFDQGTAVYPITPARESAIGSVAKNRLSEWAADAESGGKTQRLLRGWMPARTSVQHLVIRSRSTPARLKILGEGGAGRRVENRLGAEIELLYVRDEQGNWWRAAEVAEDQEQDLTPIDRRELVREYRLLVVENEPQFPLGAGKAVEQALQRLGQGNSRRQRNFTGVDLNANLANRLLDSLSGLAGGETLDLPHRSYVAVTRTAVETPLGWEGVKELGSFHITVGRW